MDKLGPLSINEKITAGALGTTVLLWIFGGSLGINAVAAALLGLAILLITNVTTWKECLSNNQAWDTYTWFAALISMATFLNKFGFISWFSDVVSAWVARFVCLGMHLHMSGCLIVYEPGSSVSSICAGADMNGAYGMHQEPGQQWSVRGICIGAGMNGAFAMHEKQGQQLS